MIKQVLTQTRVVPVLVVEAPELAVPLAQALIAGGLSCLEITLRTPAALEAVKAIASELTGAFVGVGTVLGRDQLEQSKAAGARFVVSPGFTEDLAKAAADLELDLLPGVATASDVMRALAAGHDCLKFFPAEQAGGIAVLRALSGPFPQVRFCPTGGITPESASQYLALDNVVAVGGSWLAPAEAIAARDWPRIEALARAAAGL
ncbi:MAG: bifunctional 4-hydroxy-2-oxoglutarate aldolase/2-dehydro-3-deoxy-phosphogluconate aldolase [Pseudomonadota bacterium]